MKAVFIESSGFTKSLAAHLPDSTYAELQQELMAHPDKGVPIPGCAGLRKIRTPDPDRGRGKRGGSRVVYLYVPEAKWFFMLDIYGKNEKDDLSPAEKKLLSALVNELKEQARTANRKRKPNP